MILETTTDLKKYIALATSFEFDDFAPYINKAVNKFTRKYVGLLHEELADLATDTNATIKNEAREHLRNALANFGFYLYIPLLQVQLDSSGMSIVQNENRTAASFGQIKDIRREVLNSGHDAMDLLLAVLEANPTVFTDYAANYSSINNELLVNSAAVFSKWHNIFESRQTYLALQPTILLVEDQYIHTFLCTELIEALKTDATGNLKAVKVAIQKAIVAFTVAKIANNGLFLLNDLGLRVNFESAADGRVESASYGKPTEQMQSLANEQIANGTQYLNIVKEIIEANPSEFTQCSFPLLKSATTGTGYKSYDSTGVFGI
jgi:hypothetical protein